MKFGNTSQSIVPVPNFFLTRTLRELDTFNVSTRRRYFREKDLFRLTKDMNFSNNQRKNQKKFDNYNREKYIPVHKRQMNCSSSQEKIAHVRLDSSRLEIEENAKFTSYNEFAKYTEYMNKTNVSKVTQGELRQGIKSNLKYLLERINTNFDLEKYKQLDKKTNNMLHNTIKFTPITTYNQLTENDTSNFRRTLREKIISMTVVNQQSKEKALNNINLTERDKSSMLNLPIVKRTAPTPQAVGMYHSINDPPKSQFENFKEYPIDLRDFRLPAKKDYMRKKQKETSNKLKESDEYMNTIKPESYNSFQYKNKFAETAKLTHAKLEI